VLQPHYAVQSTAGIVSPKVDTAVDFRVQFGARHVGLVKTILGRVAAIYLRSIVDHTPYGFKINLTAAAYS
jgi:hypothetical protein